MKRSVHGFGWRVAVVGAAAVFGAAGCGMMQGGSAGAGSGGQAGSAQAVSLRLSGAEEVPPVTTSATGSGTISVRPDRTVSGSVTTSGIAATMAHIHLAPRGANGPVIVPLERSGDNTWSVPAGRKLDEAHYEAYRAGNLYVNVHSAAHPGGELRAQIRP